ncbi:hypothetical protein OV090_09320 [Nannocystis sp. RBIL2]|uniref:hypothetical protein n=1 Tax=Nannocystis sp. RBIL2 TaxID=2996788 RepID=UPI0022714B04|nr:hypothetical protein [Nannocystis sp. RBIL2]MCY1064958.1 hypothetical protein [Nannocystis sp. RBIL2]
MTKIHVLGICALLACNGPSKGETETQVASETASDSTTVTVMTTAGPTTGTDTTTGTTAEPTTAGPTTSTSTSTSTSTTTTTSDTTTEPITTTETTTTTTGGGSCVPLQCDGGVYACGDCMDNDGDGLVDQADPECVSPCDDREDTFATGLPGDNMDPCKQDCFFDGNSGGGAGDCAWNLKCDPKSPGGDKCPYDEDFNNCPMDQPQQCIDECQVPNGCDCFGCCTVVVDGMSYDIFLGDQDCSLAQIDSCQQCTKNPDCDDECHPEECEVCFGETEPPPGCDDPSCEGDAQPCEIDDMGQSDCPEGFYCKTGCCHVLEPG